MAPCAHIINKHVNVNIEKQLWKTGKYQLWKSGKVSKVNIYISYVYICIVSVSIVAISTVWHERNENLAFSYQ